MCSYTGLLHLISDFEDTLVGGQLHTVSYERFNRLTSLSTKETQKRSILQ